jgi:uncharacterized membrane protein
MQKLAEFTKTTLVGGVLVILPIWITALLSLKLIAGLFAFIAPVTNSLPPDLHLRRIASAAIVVLICFMAGLIVRTGPGLRAKNAIERTLLERIPGYTLLRGLAGRITGHEDSDVFAAALVEIEEALVPAFVVEEHPDGQFTIFVPSVPTPAAGTVYILPASRVHLVDVPFTQAVSVISKWGAGSRDLLLAMKRSA